MSRPLLTTSIFIFLVGGALAMSTGPPVPEACARNMVPNHSSTPSQTGPAPTAINVSESVYVSGATLEVNIARSGGLFKGFMIQARVSENGPPLGEFRVVPGDSKSRTQMCSNSDDTANHANASDVNSVTVLWSAGDLDPSITQFQFFYTVVVDYRTFWVRVPSAEILVDQTTQGPTTTETPDITGTPNTTETPNTMTPQPEEDLILSSTSIRLIKSHGAIMCITWGLFAPVGIMLALFYKVIWPNGEWFYSHLAIMIATLVGTITGLIVIIVHASGRWLNTTPVNLPHQILGIIASVAVGVNPFLAILRCDPSSQWRWIYNWIHGTIGLITGQTAAFGAMLLGLHIYREFIGVDKDFVHYAVYSLSATVGLVVMVIGLYNIYTVNYKKSNPQNYELDELAATSEPPGSFPEKKPSYIGGSRGSSDRDDDDMEASKDFPLRIGVGVVIVTLLILLTVVNIVLIALT